MIGNLRLRAQITRESSVSRKNLSAFLFRSCIHFQTTGALLPVCLLQQTRNGLLPNRFWCAWKYHWLAQKPKSTCHWFSSAKPQSGEVSLHLGSYCRKAQATDNRAGVDSLIFFVQLLAASPPQTQKLHEPPYELYLHRETGREDPALHTLPLFLEKWITRRVDRGLVHIHMTCSTEMSMVHLTAA